MVKRARNVVERKTSIKKTPSKRQKRKPSTKKRSTKKRSTKKRSTTSKRRKRGNAGPIRAEEISETRAKGRIQKCYIGVDKGRDSKRALCRYVYMGETHDLIHRRRQHRGEIAGGAKD